MPMSMVAMPKAALILGDWPMVKKWCSHTVKDNTAITKVAQTSE